MSNQLVTEMDLRGRVVAQALFSELEKISASAQQIIHGVHEVQNAAIGAGARTGLFRRLRAGVAELGGQRGASAATDSYISGKRTLKDTREQAVSQLRATQRDPGASSEEHAARLDQIRQLNTAISRKRGGFANRQEPPKKGGTTPFLIGGGIGLAGAGAGLYAMNRGQAEEEPVY